MRRESVVKVVECLLCDHSFGFSKLISKYLLQENAVVDAVFMQ